MGAALIHEAGHFLALYLLGVPVFRFQLTAFGGTIETGAMSEDTEMICTLAGPFLALCVLLFHKCAPLLAACAFVQSIYNLLPYPDHDGGRFLKTLLCKVFAYGTGERMSMMISVATSVFLAILGIFSWIYLRLGMLSFIFLAFPAMKRLPLKIPCNRREQIVQ